MKISKEYKECMLYNLKLPKALKEGDKGILNKSKIIGERIHSDRKYKTIERSIRETLKRMEDEDLVKNKELLYNVIRALDYEDAEIMIDRMRLKNTQGVEALTDLIIEIMSKDYDNEELEEEVFALYSYLIQKAILTQNNELIEKSIKAIEKLEERG